MTWHLFWAFAVPAEALLWLGALLFLRRQRRRAAACTALGVAVLAAFVCALWAALGRPPMRTMAETRLWYSTLLPAVALALELRARLRWLPAFAALMSTIFCAANLAHPEYANSALMPALQSPWFAPHVTLYMLSYALLGAATLLAAHALARPRTDDAALLALLRPGLACLTFGMLTGALWAKTAWGHYWAWDPKETWALATWALYAAALHVPRRHARARGAMLLAAFVVLNVCWWGINYLSAARGMSVHTYAE